MQGLHAEGGTIRAPGRCDVYMGEGDDPGRLAGHTYQEGRLYNLFLKPEPLPSGPTVAEEPDQRGSLKLIP